MRMSKWMAGLFLPMMVILPQVAGAQATAVRQDSCFGESREGSCTYATTISVQFAVPVQDVGKPGAFFIGARATSGTPGNLSAINADTLGLWLYTPAGWVAFNGGAYTPVETFSALPTSRNYVVVSQQDLCQLVGNVGMELWAGYGVLQPDKQHAIDTYYATATPNVPAEHLKAVFVYSDMKDSGRYWNVLNRNPCSPDSGIPATTTDYGR